MIAHFSSKFFKSLRVVLTLALLATNLVGTQSIGFAHGVLHANFEKQTEGKPTAIEIDSSYSHGADVCHLFDALSLAGFIPIDSNSDTSIQHISFNPGKIAYTERIKDVNWTLFMNLKNLLNEQIRYATSPMAVRLYAPQPGRSLMIGVRAAF
jgi:hypothetical protein